MKLPGAINPTCVIGSPPESRDYEAGTFAHKAQIHPDARLSAFVTVDDGLRDPTTVGARTWLMAHVHIGHDAVIGRDCEIAPGSVIAGHAMISDGVKIGVNASILPFRRVGAGARIGAGAVVTKDVPAGEVWVGNPARRLR